MTTNNLIIPQGYTHRSVLIERGWTSHMINTYLTEVQKIDAPEGTSNKAYKDTEIREVEGRVREVRAAVEAVRDQVPRSGEYTHANTISRAALIERGWTPAHITRLLGGPDAYGAGIASNAAHRYGKDRVEWAEAHDARLVKRLAQVAAKKEATINAKITQDGEIVFRRINGEWMLSGMDLTEGEEVTVTKKNGSTTTAIVGEIIEDNEGKRLAKIAPKARRQRVATTAQTPVQWDDEQAPRRQMPDPRGVVGYTKRAGDVFRLGKKIVVVLKAWPYQITDDDPAAYGEHLLGFEGSKGTMFTYRDASEDEAEKVLSREAQEREAAAIAARKGAAMHTLQNVAMHGEYPSNEEAHDIYQSISGEPLWDERTIYGVGSALWVQGSRLVLVERFGMDGDNWAVNNLPGQRLYIGEITEAAREALEEWERLSEH